LSERNMKMAAIHVQFYEKKKNALLAECKKHGYKGVQAKFYAGQENSVYMSVSYPFRYWSGIGSDDVIRKAVNKVGMGKFFKESGTGTDFSRRDVGFYELKKAVKERLKKKIVKISNKVV
jgi:hypothetical protein